MVERADDDAGPPDDGERAHEDQAEAAYVEGLVARGEAARAVDGALPPGATHEIVEDEEGRTVVRRRRFSAY